MLIMDFSHTNTKEQPANPERYQQDHPQIDWRVSAFRDAPFKLTRIHSKGVKNVTEVASIEAVAAQFIAGGGSIARPEVYIPGVGSLISCRDCAGHLFSFFEDESPVRPEHITGID